MYRKTSWAEIFVKRASLFSDRTRNGRSRTCLDRGPSRRSQVARLLRRYPRARSRVLGSIAKDLQPRTRGKSPTSRPRAPPRKEPFARTKRGWKRQLCGRKTASTGNL